MGEKDKAASANLESSATDNGLWKGLIEHDCPTNDPGGGTEPDFDTLMDDEPLNHSLLKLGRSMRSISSKRSDHQSLKSLTSMASFFLDTVGGTHQPIDERQEEEEAILDEMIRGGAPAPPDGGYGWVIVFVSFVSNLILDGITCTFGVFLPAMAESFDAGKGQVAWAGSLLCGGSLCIGPIVGACTNKFGCRTVCMVGSIVASIGFIISSFADSLTLMLLSYGILGAIGFGFIYLPNIVSVGYYFEKRRALATGIAVCGSGFGATAFAPMASWLAGETTWRNVNLMYAGLLFICGCCGALIRPLEIKREALDDFGDDKESLIDADPKRQPLLYRMAEERNQRLERSSTTGSEYFVVQFPDGTMERRQKLPINVDPGVHSSFHLDQFQFTGSHTPLPPLTPVHAPLSTITESEQRQGFRSKGSVEVDSTNGQRKEKETTTTVEAHSRGIDIPTPPRHSNFSRELGGHSHSSFKRTFEGAKEIGFPRGSMDTGDHEPLSHWDDLPGSSLGQRRYSMKLVPTSILGSKVGSHIFSKRSSIASPLGSRRDSISESVDDSEPIHFQSKSEYPSIHPSLKWTQASISGSTGSVHRIIRPMSRKDIYYSGSVTHLPEYTDVVSYRQSILNLPGGSDQVRRQGHMDDIMKPQICPRFRGRLAALLTSVQTFMDFSLLKNPIFLCISLSGVVGMLGFYVPLVYIIDFCAEKGIPRDDAALLLSIIGAMNTVGRVGFGMLSDLPQVNSLYVNNFCLFGMGASVITVAWCSSLPELIAVYVLFGLFLSGFISLTSITLVDLLGLDNLTNAFGLLIFFRGFASIIGSPFAGFLYDTFQSYDVPFILAGCFLVASSLISCLIPIVTKCQSAKSPGPHLSNPFDPGVHTVLEDILEVREPEEEEGESIKLDSESESGKMQEHGDTSEQPLTANKAIEKKTHTSEGENSEI